MVLVERDKRKTKNTYGSYDQKKRKENYGPKEKKVFVTSHLLSFKMDVS